GWDAELSETSVVLPPQTSTAIDFSITSPTTAPRDISETVTVTVEFQEEGISYSDNCIVHTSPRIEVISPTTGAPAIVGDPSYPTEFMVKVSTGMPYIPCTNISYVSPDIFSAKVGDKPAEIRVLPSFSDNKEGIYTLSVFPSSQDMGGLYNLTINLTLGEMITDCDVEPDAVIYSTGANADTRLIMDRSGSMTYDMSPTDPRTRMSQAKVAA
ncbi:hypothetical protein KA005_58350, partial [bacterium]|nr:hypothetical protein [bacterium]